MSWGTNQSKCCFLLVNSTDEMSLNSSGTIKFAREIQTAEQKFDVGIFGNTWNSFRLVDKLHKPVSCGVCSTCLILQLEGALTRRKMPAFNLSSPVAIPGAAFSGKSYSEIQIALECYSFDGNPTLTFKFLWSVNLLMETNAVALQRELSVAV